MNYQDYIRPELLSLIPVLYLIGLAVKKTKIPDKFIPLLLGAVSVGLCSLWIFANSETATAAEILTAIFTAITQGVLIAGASVYAHELYAQSKKEE